MAVFIYCDQVAKLRKCEIEHIDKLYMLLDIIDLINELFLAILKLDAEKEIKDASKHWN